MTKLQQQTLQQFKDRNDDWSFIKESDPYFVVNQWVSHVHEAWLFGAINLKDYISLLRVDILKEV